MSDAEPLHKRLAGAEFDAADRTNAHRLVATGMMITFLTVAISQDWWKHLRDWVATKTHGASKPAPSGGGGAGGNLTP
jgi:hypothetical protein